MSQQSGTETPAIAPLCPPTGSWSVATNITMGLGRDTGTAAPEMAVASYLGSSAS